MKRYGKPLKNIENSLVSAAKCLEVPERDASASALLALDEAIEGIEEETKPSKRSNSSKSCAAADFSLEMSGMGLE